MPSPTGSSRTLDDRRKWLEAAIIAAGGWPSRQGLLVTYQEERYFLGHDRRPQRSQVVLGVCALQPGIDRYWFPYSYDAGACLVIVPTDNCYRGKTIREEDYGELTDKDNDWLAATELFFAHPLEPQVFYQFSYTIEHKYERSSNKLPKREFRRVNTTPVCRTLRLGISFDPNTLPDRLVRCTWRSSRHGEPIHGSEVHDPRQDFIAIDNPRPGGYGWVWAWPSADQPVRAEPGGNP
jgi:hypothetical protein